jgi:putative tricarboxylic transport membrane protein
MLLKKSLVTLIAGSLAAIMLLTACSSSSSTGAQKQNYPDKALEFIAPAGAGGGWDVTIRTVAKTLQDTKLVKVPMPVTNKPGGGGGVALSYLGEKKGSDSIITVYSPPLLLINLNGSTPLGYKDTTPIAKLIADYGVFVVSKNSKYKSIKDVMEALKKDPKSVKIAGTSAAGSLDHLQFLSMAKTAGVQKLKEIDFISFQDGSAPAQLLGGHVDLLSTGLADVKALIDSGDLVGLATTADKRIGEGKFAQIKTCKEEGINATFVNWRGLFGAPGMPDYAVKFWRETLKKMSDSEEWKKAAKSNGWDITYSDGDEFNKFLETTNVEYTKLLQEIGMLKK